MPATGITAAGYVTVPLATRIANMGAAVLSTIDPTYDLSPATPDGQFIGIVCATAAAIDELGQAIYNAYNRDDAEGAALDNLGDITGTPREGPTYSQVYAVLGLAPGTYAASTWDAGTGALTTGILIANVTGATAQQFANYAAVTPTSLSGTCTVSASTSVTFTAAQTLVAGSLLVFGSQPGVVYFVASTTSASTTCTLTVPYNGTPTAGTTATPGTPVLMQAVTIGETPSVNDGTLTQITTAVTGWSYVDNPSLDVTLPNSSQGQVGQNEETDTAYALRQEEDVPGEGGDTSASLIAALNELGAAQVPPVNIVASILENDTNAPQTISGLVVLPHSFAPIVWDGGSGWATTSAAEALIGQVIWKNRPPGIAPAGQIIVPIDDPYLGEQQSAYSVPAELPLFVTATVVPRPGAVWANLVGAIQAALVAAAGAPTPASGIPPVGQLAPGMDVLQSQLSAVIQGVPGVFDVQNVQFGFAASPGNTAPLAVDAAQIATISIVTVATNVVVLIGTYP